LSTAYSPKRARELFVNNSNHPINTRLSSKHPGNYSQKKQRPREAGEQLSPGESKKNCANDEIFAARARSY
jgi:hypothetical protein